MRRLPLTTMRLHACTTLLLRGVAAVLLASTLIGCGVSATALGGSVASAPVECGARSEPRRPLAGARVKVECPGQGAPLVSAVSDAEGRFFMETGKVIPIDCRLVIEREGYLSRTFPVRDVCVMGDAWPPEAACTGLGVTVELLPRASEVESQLPPERDMQPTPPKDAGPAGEGSTP